MSGNYVNKYEPPYEPPSLTVSNKGIQGNKKWALWSDSDSLVSKAKKVRLWIMSNDGPKGDDKLIITPEGNVGIGISEPSAKLQISGDLVLEKIASPPGPLSDGAARIFSDDSGVLHIQCPSGKSGSGTLQVTGNLSVDGPISADKGLSVKNGLLEAKAGLTAEGALSAGAVNVSGGDLEAQSGLKVSAGTLEAKAGMTAGGTLTAGAVTVSGNSLEAQAGLKVSAGLLEAKAGMTAGGALTAEAVTVSGNALEAQAGLKVSAGLLEAKGGMTVEGTFIVKKNSSVTVEGGTLNVDNGLNVGPDKFVVGADGAACFQEKATFKNGIDITGALKIGSLKVGSVAAEVQAGSAAIAEDLDIGGRLLFRDKIIGTPIFIRGTGGVDDPDIQQIGQSWLPDKPKKGLRLMQLRDLGGKINIDSVSLFDTDGESQALVQLNAILGDIYNNHIKERFGIITSYKKWERKEFKNIGFVQNFKLIGLNKILNIEDNCAEHPYAAVFWYNSDKDEFEVIEVLENPNVVHHAHIQGSWINGSFIVSPGESSVPSSSWLWQCNNGIGSLNYKDFNGKSIRALSIFSNSEAHFYGKVYGNGIVELSDRRLKKSIAPLRDVLLKLGGLHGVSFEWNDIFPHLGLVSGKREIGIMAQEARDIFPEIVYVDHNNYLNMSYSKLTVLLLEAIKELDERVKSLERTTA
jgi:hypothetical protein